METKLVVLNEYKESGALSPADIEKLSEAAELLRNGALVAFPTETVYGLGGNALMSDASAKIYAAKGRPSDNPLIVHISKWEEIYPLVSEIPEAARILNEKFWPGPMTMVLRKSDVVPKATTGGLDTVAVRMPVDPVANKLIELAGVPIAAPSANRSGRPSTTTAAHCVEDLDGRIEMIVDGGSCEIGLESTIIDVTEDPPVLLRPGAVTKEMIESALGVEIRKDVALQGPLAEGVKPKAPGMKYRHYAPKAPVTVVSRRERVTEERDMELAEAIAKLALAQEGKVAIIASEECLADLRKLDTKGRLSEMDLKSLGSRLDEGSIAHELFGVLREMDDDEAEFVVAEGFGETDLGLAIMNRLKKAAAWQIMYID